MTVRLIGFGLAVVAAGLTACGEADVIPDKPDSAVVAARADYQGEYTRADGTPIFIADTEDGLVVIVSGNTFRLVPTGLDRFDLDGVPESVRFDRDAGGEVESVTDSQGKYPRRTANLPDAILAAINPAARAPYTYAPPVSADDGLPVGHAGDAGLDVAGLESLIERIQGDPEFANVHSLLVQKDGSLVLERYFAGFDAGMPHNLRSATKGIIAALAGAAVEQGEIALSDTPLKALADARGVSVSAHKAELSLGEMLDMRHGLQCNDWNEDSPGHESRIYATPDWVSTTLALPEAPEGETASYCSAMPLMVGRYLELATGQALPDYADAVLLSPLGITRGAWTWDFTLAPLDAPHGAQIHMRPRDMLRVASLYADDGVAPDGTRLLPEGWAADTFGATMPLGDWRRYGRYWWSYDVEREGHPPVAIHFASGVGGQRIALVPELDLAVVMTGGSFAQGRGGPRRVLEAIVEAVER